MAIVMMSGFMSPADRSSSLVHAGWDDASGSTVAHGASAVTRRRFHYIMIYAFACLAWQTASGCAKTAG
jgi:hypothetical protein